MPAADFHAADINHRIGGMRLAAGQFESFLHAEDAFDLRECGEGFEVLMGAFVTDRGDDCLGGPVNGSGLVAKLGDFVDDLFDEVRGGAGRCVDGER